MNSLLLHLSQVPDVCRHSLTPGCVPTCPLDNQIPRENLQPYGPMLILNTFKAIAQHFNKHLFNVVRNDVQSFAQHFYSISKLGPSLSSSEHQNSSGSGAKAYFCRWPSAALRYTVPRLHPGKPSGIHSPCWHDVLIQNDTSSFQIDFKEALILIKQSNIRLELESWDGDTFVFIASIHTGLKLSALQTLRRPLVDYWADSQWSVNPGGTAQFGYILRVCERTCFCADIVYIAVSVCVSVSLSPRWQWLARADIVVRCCCSLLQCICLFTLGSPPQCLPPQWSPMFCTALLAASNMTSGFRVSFFLHLISFSQRVSWGYAQYPLFVRLQLVL